MVYAGANASETVVMLRGNGDEVRVVKVPVTTKGFLKMNFEPSHLDAPALINLSRKYGTWKSIARS